MINPIYIIKSKRWKQVFLFSLALLASSIMYGQVTGTITSADSGEPLIGASILISGTSTGTITDLDGKFSISANPGDVLEVSYTGFATQNVTVGDSKTLDISLSEGVLIDEVVVTGYAIQRKRDITGAVSVVGSEELNQIQATSFTQKLEGRAAGVNISTSGEPGEGTTVRIRGIGSFQNNDPLYVIDGVPTTDNFNTGFNPNDIESIQILKDASAASIYGARANNGVVIVTTKKGKNGKTNVTYNASVGVSNPVATPHDYMITDPMDYSNYIWNKYEANGETVPQDNPYGLGRGVLPTYSFPAGNTADESSYSYPDNIIMKANQSGTNWSEEVFDPALLTEHNIGISGGNDAGRYYFSTGYMEQQGTMINTYFKRFSIRANTEFTKGNFTFGENLSLTRINSVGQDGISGGNQDEQGIMSWITLMNPLTPVYDVSGENFGGDKANGVSNGSNPVAALERAKDNEGAYYKVLGNAYASVKLVDGLVAKTSLGIEHYNNFSQGFSFPTNENRESNSSNGFGEDWGTGFNWTWTNTLRYNTVFSDVHNFQALIGYEAIKNRFRNIGGGLANYFVTGQDVWYLNGGLADPASRNVYSNGGFNTLASSFAKVDYAYGDKYLVGLTVRRDGSSNFGDAFKYGIFPAVSVGWRVSEESFLTDSDWLSDLKVRFGWGITGNQSIVAGNSADRFGGGTSSTFYDLSGQNTGLTTGYALTNRGNADTRWEENTSTNIGIDASLFDGKINVVLDLYQRNTDGLLFNPSLPGTSGTAAAPFVNIGEMQNRGVDLSLDYNNRVNKDFSWDVGLIFSAYRNEILDIDGNVESFLPGGFDSRIGDININKIGSSISSFYGFVADGIFTSQAEVDAHADQPGKLVGGLRFKDINGFDAEGRLTGTPDGIINDADKDVIGDPHPDFTAGLNLGVNFKNFDLTAFFFASSGNQLFNYTKLFDVFGLFNSNVRKDVLTRSWSPSNPGGDWPQTNIADGSSQTPSSFYVEDASYIRLRTLQLGYTIPRSALGNRFSSLRVYVQAQNLFTITGYEGVDPAPSNFGVQDGLNGDIWNGFDFGNYPSNQIIMFGVNASF